MNSIKFNLTLSLGRVLIQINQYRLIAYLLMFNHQFNGALRFNDNIVFAYNVFVKIIFHCYNPSDLFLILWIKKGGENYNETYKNLLKQFLILLLSLLSPFLRSTIIFVNDEFYSVEFAFYNMICLRNVFRLLGMEWNI